MRSFFTWFQVPHRAPVVGDQRIDSTYRYWRVRILYSMYFGYAVFYFTRKSFTFITPLLITRMHISNVDIGLIASFFYIAYGCSKFLSGILSDRVNAQVFMACGLFMTGVMNILFGMSSHLYWFVILWFVNAIFQGWGWPPCAKLLTHWYAQKERGRWWGAWNTCHNVGGALIPLIAAISAKYWGWRYAMVVPGVVAIVTSLALLNRLRDVPASMGLPTIEEYRPDDVITRVEKTSLSTREILMRYVLTNPYLWILAIAYVFIYIVRTAINDWGNLYLVHQGYSLFEADGCLSFFEIGGFFGSLAAGALSDYVFKGMRGQTNVLFSFGTMLAVLLLWFVPGKLFIVHAACIFLIGFMVFGPQMLIGVAAAELSHKQAAGASTGFIGLFGYVGAALSGLPLGVVLQDYSWNGFFLVLVTCCLLACVLLAQLWDERVGSCARGPLLMDNDCAEKSR